MFNEAYAAPWINDEYKITSNLTLTLGLRFDYQFARTESNNKYSTFDPSTPNPGAGGIPGALIFAGKGPGLAGTRTFERPGLNNFGPRASDLPTGSETKTRFAAVTASTIPASRSTSSSDSRRWDSRPARLPRTTRTASKPAFYLDNGFPQNLIVQPPFIDPTFANGTAPLAVAKDGLTLPRYQNWSLTSSAS